MQKKLHTVDLSDNAFGIMTIDPLEKFLSQHAPLQHLILANNGLGPAAASAWRMRLRTYLMQRRLLVMSPNFLPLFVAAIVSKMVRWRPGLNASWPMELSKSFVYLRMAYGLRVSNISCCMAWGLNSPAIEKLDLQDNTFTEVGASALAEVISNWPKIKELGISDCLLSAKGGQLLGDALSKLSPLESFEHLRLQYNEIELDGIETIFNAIKTNIPNLKVLELNGTGSLKMTRLSTTSTTFLKSAVLAKSDELDDMEIESDEELTESEEEAEIIEKLNETIKDAEEEEESNVAIEKSKSVDKLADESRKL